MIHDSFVLAEQFIQLLFKFMSKEFDRRKGVGILMKPKIQNRACETIF